MFGNNGTDPASVSSDCVEFGHDEDSHRLVKRRADAETLLVGAPVQTGDGLCGQRDVLQEIHGPSNTHVYFIRALLSPLGRILTGTMEKQELVIESLNEALFSRYRQGRI